MTDTLGSNKQAERLVATVNELCIQVTSRKDGHDQRGDSHLESPLHNESSTWPRDPRSSVLTGQQVLTGKGTRECRREHPEQRRTRPEYHSFPQSPIRFHPAIPNVWVYLVKNQILKPRRDGKHRQLPKRILLKGTGSPFWWLQAITIKAHLVWPSFPLMCSRDVAFFLFFFFLQIEDPPPAKRLRSALLSTRTEPTVPLRSACEQTP